MKSRLRYTTIGTLSIIWLNIVIPLFKDAMVYGPTIFPKTPINQLELLKLTASSLLLAFSLFFQGLDVLRKPNYSNQLVATKKITPIILIMMMSVPFVFGYVFDQGFQSVGQMILDIGTALMDEDFDDLPPGIDPLGWDTNDGNWTTVNDNGNIVYYQDDNSDKESLSISTTGNSSWTDYVFEVDLKFVEGNPTKSERGALLLFRYQGGNNYYFLWLKEAQDTLELHNRGDMAHMVASTSCTLVQDTWYHVKVTIIGQNAWVTIDDVPYFTSQAMNGAFDTGNVAIGTSYYKVMFDNILVEPR